MSVLQEQLAQMQAERDEARKEVDRLRACAQIAELKTCRIEYDGNMLIVTMPHAGEENERQVAQAFAEIYTELNKIGKTVADEKADAADD